MSCSRCGGSGYIPMYSHIAGGVCFKCGGYVRPIEYNERIIYRQPIDEQEYMKFIIQMNDENKYPF